MCMETIELKLSDFISIKDRLTAMHVSDEKCILFTDRFRTVQTEASRLNSQSEMKFTCRKEGDNLYVWRVK